LGKLKIKKNEDIKGKINRKVSLKRKKTAKGGGKAVFLLVCLLLLK